MPVMALAVLVLLGGVAYSGALKGTVTPVAEGAAVDYFLKVDGVDGESKDDKHKNEIDVESWSWGLSNTGSHTGGGGGGAGKSVPQDLVVTKGVDKASPKLMLACANGKHFKEVILTVSEDKRPDYIRYSFFDVFCTEFKESGANGALPMEQVSFNYAQVKVEYKEQDAKGTPAATHQASWDFKESKVE